MLIDIVLVFVLVVVKMVMAVQRIRRLRLGNWTLWRREMGNRLGLEVGEEPLTSPTVLLIRAIRMMCVLYGSERYWT